MLNRLPLAAIARITLGPVGVGAIGAGAVALSLLLSQGCATQAPPATPTGATEPKPTTLAAAAAAPEAASSEDAVAQSSGDDGLDADIAALSESTRPADAAKATPATSDRVRHQGSRGESVQASPPPGAADTTGREIVYRVTPKGLVIEIDGIHLRPEAKPFRQESGAYGIELVVNAESFDGRQYWVNKPAEGPLSIAGKVEGKSGQRERFRDQREGSGGEVVMEGVPRRFKQRWPGRGQPKLWPGQTVTLEVGLWGVRIESERERPVRRLFEVKMVAGNKSQAIITPPTMDWGS
jgi:hypothetical protein